MVPSTMGATVGASPSPKPANPKPATPKPAKTKPKLGLRAWMERVLVECDRAAVGFEADPVHDLRVALRRCRSLADGLMAMDPDSSWRDMKKAGKKLFQALGDLRDMQVMQEWIEKLGDADDPVTVKLLNHVHAREAAAKQEAFKALDQFDRNNGGSGAGRCRGGRRGCGRGAWSSSIWRWKNGRRLTICINARCARARRRRCMNCGLASSAFGIPSKTFCRNSTQLGAGI